MLFHSRPHLSSRHVKRKQFLMRLATRSEAQDGGSYTMTGTLEYAAPEVLDGESPSEQQERLETSD